MSVNIVSGEKLQDIANVYLGIDDDFNYNPYISKQINKHKNMREINYDSNYNNPTILFCYAHRINILADKINYFQNDFILITHNSDQNIVNDDINVQKIYNSNKLLKWYAQNLCFEHSKLFLLPIGIANTQWEHGSNFHNFYNTLSNDSNTNTTTQHIKKTKSIYFLFDINTNREKRTSCYNSIVKKLPFLNQLRPYDNFKRLSEYEFCICPEGNGVDTHRLWEALYLKCVPIVINSPFINLIKKYTNLPMIIVNSWDELDIDNLQDYNSFDFINNESNKYLNLDYYVNDIK